MTCEVDGDTTIDICYGTVMISDAVQYSITGRDAATVARSIEQGVVSGRLAPGEALPSVRTLARTLGISPTTVAAAYRDLRLRGVLVTHDRSRTAVAHRPPLATRLAPEPPEGTVDLASGNPDPALLPDLAAALGSIEPAHRLYGDEPAVEELLELARSDLADDGVAAEEVMVTAGGLDGIERVLEVHCRLGDRVAVEDPCYIGTIDLVRTLGLEPVGVHVDDEGVDPGMLDDVLSRGVSAVLIVPRAQNPTGAALTAERAAAIRQVLAEHPEPLVIEDDAASWVSGVDHQPITTDRERWAVVRSVAKSLGPDLRVALLAADRDTVTRVQGRQRLGTGWVSHLLQRLTVSVWRSARDDGTLEGAAASYRARRTALIDALAGNDLVAYGASGLNVWVPVIEEVPVVQGLAARGWAVQAGEPFRLSSQPGIRVTVAGMSDDQGEVFAHDLIDVLGHRLGTRRG